MASIYDWSLTPGNNATADADINWAENQLPYTVNDSARQMMARIAAFWRDQGGALTSSGTNTITLTTNNAFSAYANGMMLAFKAGGTNTGATTLNVNGIGAKGLRIVLPIAGETSLSGGEIQQGGHYLVQYDSAANSGVGAWILLNSSRQRIEPTAFLIGTPSNISPITGDQDGVTLHGLGVTTISANGDVPLRLRRRSSDGSIVSFFRDTTSVGSISITGSATAYNTASDYRLKEHITDLLGSGARIDALRPRSGTWKADGTPFRGFLAHEFAEVYPRAVSGEKDAVDEDGNPIMQAMDAGTPETIADIIAELQSLRQRVAALEGN